MAESTGGSSDDAASTSSPGGRLCMTEVLRDVSCPLASATSPSQGTTDAMSAFEPLVGYRRVGKKRGRNCSVLYSWGAVVEHVETADAAIPKSRASSKKVEYKRHYFCLATDQCRRAKTRIQINSGSTTGNTTHLEKIHGVKSRAPAAIKAAGRYEPHNTLRFLSHFSRGFFLSRATLRWYINYDNLPLSSLFFF